MYFLHNEHNPPHIHVIYGEYSSVISIKDYLIINGYIPSKAYSLVKEWMEIYQSELLLMWETQEFKKLPSLE